MKTSTTVRRLSRSFDRELLANLLTRVEADLHATDDSTPIALSLLATDVDGVDAAIKALDPDNPVSALYGFTCPSDWKAFGVIVPGRAHHPDQLDAAPETVRLGLLVSRAGDHVTLLRPVDGPPEVTIGKGNDHHGRLPDACRRALGLTTAPPDSWPGQLWTLMWVESLLAESMADPGSVSWLQAVRAHPAIDHVLRLDPAVASELPHRFIEMVEVISRQFSWDRLRLLACEGSMAGFGISAELASWMDEGMFSREVLSVFPPLASLLVDLEPVAAAEVLNGIDEALASWATQ